MNKTLKQELTEMMSDDNGLRHCCEQPGIENDSYWVDKIMSVVEKRLPDSDWAFYPCRSCGYNPKLIDNPKEGLK